MGPLADSSLAYSPLTESPLANSSLANGQLTYIPLQAVIWLTILGSTAGWQLAISWTIYKTNLIKPNLGIVRLFAQL